MADVIFWCEFPNTVNWPRLDKLLKKNKLKVKTYIAAASRKGFENKKSKLKKYKSIEVAGVWPILTLDKGYWFSGFLDSKSIDKLKGFGGLNVKIDVEPPFSPKIKGNFGVMLWLTKYFLKWQKNRKYFIDTVRRLAKNSRITLSTFPCPRFALRRYGFFKDDNLSYSYMFYSSFIPKFLKGLYKFYYKGFIRRRLKEDGNTYFALGLIGKGIFKFEPVYKNAIEFEEDIEFLKKNNVKNFVIFRLGAILEKERPDVWLRAIKKI